jgi:biopolymer transport protein ExbD
MAGGAQDPNGGIIGGINVTPLVDIVLVLLIIFIVTARIIDQPAVPLDLPKATQAEGVQVVFSVVVSSDGLVRINSESEPVPDDDALLHLAQDALARDPELRAVIQADGSVPHRRVLGILDTLKRAGLSKVAFGAEPEPEATEEAH